jgi:hypothetical protein
MPPASRPATALSLLGVDEAVATGHSGTEASAIDTLAAAPLLGRSAPLQRGVMELSERVLNVERLFLW